EAPSFNKPTINIGDRQKGRMQAESVINCNPSKADIVNAINISLSKEFREKIKNSINPYGDGNTSSKIINIIKQALSQNINLKKKFYDIV
ncbi:UDP-N-acetylglucosamine 2-epimerase, partial [Clostridium gasigenes]